MEMRHNKRNETKLHHCWFGLCFQKQHQLFYHRARPNHFVLPQLTNKYNLLIFLHSARRRCFLCSVVILRGGLVSCISVCFTGVQAVPEVALLSTTPPPLFAPPLGHGARGTLPLARWGAAPTAAGQPAAHLPRPTCPSIPVSEQS